MIRLYVPPGDISGERITARGDSLHYLRNVLRLGKSAEVGVFDGEGGEYLCRIEEITDSRAVLAVAGFRRRSNEPSLDITLALGISKPKSIEFSLQKTTELGVKRFIPLLTERSLPPPGGAKLSRWRKIVAEAARQCGRSVCPEVAEPRKFQGLLENLPRFGLALFPWEEEEATLIGRVLEAAECSDAMVFIGPEGGFSAGEAEAARVSGAVPVSLGPRIFRSETAACAAVSMLLCRFDLTPPAFPGGAGRAGGA